MEPLAPVILVTREPTKQCICYVDACPAIGDGSSCCGGKSCSC